MHKDLGWSYVVYLPITLYTHWEQLIIVWLNLQHYLNRFPKLLFWFSKCYIWTSLTFMFSFQCEYYMNEWVHIISNQLYKTISIHESTWVYCELNKLHIVHDVISHCYGECMIWSHVIGLVLSISVFYCRIFVHVLENIFDTYFFPNRILLLRSCTNISVSIT